MDYYKVSFFGYRKIPIAKALKELGIPVSIQTSQKWENGRWPRLFHEATVKTFDVGSRGAGLASEEVGAFVKELTKRFPECQVSVCYHAVDY